MRFANLTDYVTLENYEENGHCCMKNCNCSSTYTHFWEQVAKHNRCFDLVEQREMATGKRHDYVVKIRPDMPQAQSRVSCVRER